MKDIIMAVNVVTFIFCSLAAATGHIGTAIFGLTALLVCKIIFQDV